MFQSDQTEVERSVKCGSVECGQNNNAVQTSLEIWTTWREKEKLII
jgi:hypothetical protein